MIVLTHRGLVTPEHSENTLDAFQSALQTGQYQGIECDVRLSRDGELILVHDVRLGRIAGDPRRVSECTARELSELRLLGGGSIPTLNDITRTIPAPMRLDFEVKDPKATGALIRKLQTSTSLRQRTIVSSFYPSVLMRMKQECPDVQTIYLVRTWPLPLQSKLFWRRVARIAPWGLGFRSGAMRRNRISMMQRKGFVVAVWDERPRRKEARRVFDLQPDIAIVRRIP